MQLTIFCLSSPEKRGNLIDFHEIGRLQKEIKQEYNFNAEIITDLPLQNDHNFFLLYRNELIPFEKEKTSKMVLMDISLSEMTDYGYLETFSFAALIRHKHRLKDSPYIYGKKAVAESAGLACIDASLQNDYVLITNGEEKGWLKLLIQYLEAYDKMGFGSK